MAGAQATAGDVFATIKRSPSLMIALAVVGVGVAYYMYKKSSASLAAATPAATTATPAAFVPVTGTYTYEQDLHQTAVPTPIAAPPPVAIVPVTVLPSAPPPPTPQPVSPPPRITPAPVAVVPVYAPPAATPVYNSTAAINALLMSKGYQQVANPTTGLMTGIKMLPTSGNITTAQYNQAIYGTPNPVVGQSYNGATYGGMYGARVVNGVSYAFYNPTAPK
jgi:hypothetical protein